MLKVIAVILDIILTAYICHAVHNALPYKDKSHIKKERHENRSFYAGDELPA